MRNFLVATMAAVTLAASAEAGLVCVTPGEMKVLQSAALQQQLMVAALSCHQSADYNRFVTAYRAKLVQSDTELKSFFAARRRGEDYNAYKTRIANIVSLKSLHDPRFCDSAQQVFDLALGRGAERRGLVPEPPRLIETGYEGCRNVDDKLIEAAAPPKPEIKVAAAVPAPKPAFVPQPAPRPASPLVRLAVMPMPKPVLAPKPAPKPVQIAQAEPWERPAMAPKAAPHAVVDPPKPLPPVRVAEARPAVPPQPFVAPTEPPRAIPQVRPADPAPIDDPSADEMPAPEDRYADDETAPAPRYNPPPQRYAAAERPDWTNRYRRDEPAARAPYNEGDDDPYAGSNVPNAYRAGAQWVSDPDSGWRRPAAGWRPASYYPPPSRWRRTGPNGSYMVLGPDGRWVVVIGRGPRWARD